MSTKYFPISKILKKLSYRRSICIIRLSNVSEWFWKKQTKMFTISLNSFYYKNCQLKLCWKRHFYATVLCDEKNFELWMVSLNCLFICHERPFSLTSFIVQIALLLGKLLNLQNYFKSELIMFLIKLILIWYKQSYRLIRFMAQIALRYDHLFNLICEIWETRIFYYRQILRQYLFFKDFSNEMPIFVKKFFW